MPDLRVERWGSSEAREEVHFFLAGTQIYLLGFNPVQIDEQDVLHLLEKNGFVVPKEKT